MSAKNNVILAGSANIIHGSSDSSIIIQGSSNEILNKNNVFVIGDNIKAETNDAFYVGCTNGFQCSGDIVAFSTSDERLKENIKPIKNCLGKTLSLDAIEFEWNDIEKLNFGKDIGIIAQQVKEIAPELVRVDKDGFLTVKYDKLITLLIGAIQEQEEIIKEIEKEL